MFWLAVRDYNIHSFWCQNAIYLRKHFLDICHRAFSALFKCFINFFFLFLKKFFFFLIFSIFKIFFFFLPKQNLESLYRSRNQRSHPETPWLSYPWADLSFKFKILFKFLTVTFERWSFVFVFLNHGLDDGLGDIDIGEILVPFIVHFFA